MSPNSAQSRRCRLQHNGEGVTARRHLDEAECTQVAALVLQRLRGALQAVVRRTALGKSSENW
jgi:hypothetical protein